MLYVEVTSPGVAEHRLVVDINEMFSVPREVRDVLVCDGAIVPLRHQRSRKEKLSGMGFIQIVGSRYLNDAVAIAVDPQELNTIAALILGAVILYKRLILMRRLRRTPFGFIAANEGDTCC